MFGCNGDILFQYESGGKNLDVMSESDHNEYLGRYNCRSKRR